MRRSYEGYYYPNLANLPQRRFKLCFGVRTGSSAALRLSEEDGSAESESLIICKFFRWLSNNNDF